MGPGDRRFESCNSDEVLVERRNHNTEHWIYDVFYIKLSIDDVDLQGKLTRPVKVKLRGVKKPKSWQTSHLEIKSFRTNIDGLLNLDGTFEVPVGTYVGHRFCLELKYRLVRGLGHRANVRGLSSRLPVHPGMGAIPLF